MSPNLKSIYDTQLSPKDLREMEFEFDDEVPDVIIDGKIDLAEIAMEQIALVIDDFPVRTAKFSSLNRNSTRRPRKR